MKKIYGGFNMANQHVEIFAGAQSEQFIGGPFAAITKINGRLESSVSGCATLERALKSAESMRWNFLGNSYT